MIKHAYPDGAVFGLLLLIVCSTPTGLLGQVPEGYEMVVIRTTHGIPSVPQINDQSQVVWSESYPPSISNIFMYDGGEIVQLTDDTHYDLRPAINSKGTLVWSRGQDWSPPFDLVLKDGESFVPIPGNPTSFGQAQVNDNGQVAWYQDVSDEDGEARRVEVFLYDGQIVQQISDNGLSNQGVRINNAGQIVWTRYNFNVNPWLGTITLFSDGVTHELTDGEDQSQRVDINDLGQVSWDSPPNRILMMWEDGVTKALFEDGGGPQVNDKGDIAFGRWNDKTDEGERWLYKEGQFHILPQFGYRGGRATINNHAEIAQRATSLEGEGYVILMLRRCDPGTGSACTEDFECDDASVCTEGKCDCGHCAFTSHLYGDSNGDGTVDLTDILCVLDAFQGDFSACPITYVDIARCEPDGVIDLLDILAVLDAFQGRDPCCS